MWNFKKALMGGHNHLDIREQAEWPDLVPTAPRINEENSTEIRLDKGTQSDTFRTNSLQSSSGFDCLPSSCDFPDLSESKDKLLERKNKLHSFSGHSTNDSQPNLNMNKGSTRSLKIRSKKTSKLPISIDLNMLLKVSLSLSEQKRQRKRMMHHLTKRPLLLEKISAKSTPCGNKLDSDCPIRHKGKKRPHKRRKLTTIKRGFHWAAQKSSRSLPCSSHYTERMNNLKQIILAGIGKVQSVDDLVTNIGDLSINDVQHDQDEKNFSSDVLDRVKSIIHTKKFRPYCNHIMKLSIKNKSCDLIKMLRTYQDKSFVRDAINSKAKKRYVCGCHESRKLLRAGSVKLLLMANNLIVDSGMPPILQELLQISKNLDVPVIFAGTSLDLGMWTLKKRKTSVIAVLNYEGAEKLFTEVVEELESSKEDYEKLTQAIAEQLQKGNKTENISSKALEEQLRQSILSKLSL